MSLPTLSAEDEGLLLAAPLFSDLDRETVVWLLGGARLRSNTDGGPLFRQHDAAEHFFVMLAGRASLYALTPAGDRSIIEVVDPGNSFAEGAIFGSNRYPLHAETAAGSRWLEIPSAPFLRRLAERSGLTAHLLGSLARWQGRLLDEITALKSQGPVQRLGLFLLAQCPAGAQGEIRIRLPLSKGDLASRIGITPESLSRALGRLRSQGVGSQGRDIVIADPEALRRFCGG